MKTALILIDLQNDFCTGGALAVKESDDVIKTANEVIALCQNRHDGDKNIAIIASQDWHPANHMSFAVNSGQPVGELGELNGIPQVWWPVHCVQGQFGAEFHPALNQSAIQEVFRKGENPQLDSYSAFFDNDHQSKTRLHEWLTEQKIQRLLVLGIATDYCVKFTVLDALMLGYETYVIVDGCRGVNIQADDSKHALEEMAAKGAKLISQNEVTSIL
ncbi:pyrazinamidase/nicotinamidase [Xenorhabdus mauleonii]|uniref:Nicotinamidase n=1 Tax=Xenorhabdus mauleonii TaxID=351675 RepID=A0A1I3MEW7_9GAMM|nr:bifunctional nicotinamidase/pyrazinamidase [Xenorhabdus mauleonii]PHM45490.1 pyrazinamidase/nicotinamidase [Xenorhabdus mauleonii]SFI95492.1 nicotinamidase/pyrazinamidase [Xenorhabdus mauleonii]